MLVAVAFLTIVAPLGQTVLAFVIVGVGTWSCQAWLEARKNKQSDVTEQWALGFLSGAAFATKDKTAPLRGQPPQAFDRWLDRYCGSHPSEVISHATETFVNSQEIGQ
jgi:hypothetical protein